MNRWTKVTLLAVSLLMLAACQAAAPTSAPAVSPPPGIPTGTPFAVPSFSAHLRLLPVNPDQELMVERVDTRQPMALFTSGTKAVPIGVPQYLSASAVGMTSGAIRAEWRVSGPVGSKLALEPVEPNPAGGIPMHAARLTPDLPGRYTIRAILQDAAGRRSPPGEMIVTAAPYTGAAACRDCHREISSSWEKTSHAISLARRLNEPTNGFNFENCAFCHTLGYYPLLRAGAGGFWDTAFNTLKNAALPAPQAGAYESLPAGLKALGGVQCENCHGPGGLHLPDGAGTAAAMSAGFSSGPCEQCHNDGRTNTKGEQYRNSKHMLAAELTSAGGNPECARCHSAAGFIDFIDGVPEEKQRSFVTAITCAVCHDPHGSPNRATLRLVGTPRNIPIPVKAAGDSAVCMECHNARSTAEQVVKSQPEYPHFSAAAEAVTGAGGYDFGMKIQNSNHGQVGMEGGQRGPCVTCHMFPTPGGDRNIRVDPATGKQVTVTLEGHNLLGSHSFAVTATQAGRRLDNIAACLACHPGLKGRDNFNDLPLPFDYDGNGKVDGPQTEIQNLLLKVRQALEQKGVRSLETYPYFFVPETAATLEIKAAIYNYRFIQGVVPNGAGRAAAIHNFRRSAGLLQVSYARLTGMDIPGVKLLYSP